MQESSNVNELSGLEEAEEAPCKVAADSTTPTSSSPTSAVNVIKDCDTGIPTLTETRAPETGGRCKSPGGPVQKTADMRQFQKTRSFSAVEETHDKNVASEQSKTKLPFKEVAHSRSEQLETGQQAGRQKDNVGSKKELDEMDEYPRNSEDTLIMQFDYCSHDQPMSLQYEATYERTPEKAGCSGRSGGGSGAGSRRNSNMRKSGRDLTELGAEVARENFDRCKANRISSRPRLEFQPQN